MELGRALGRPLSSTPRRKVDPNPCVGVLADRLNASHDRPCIPRITVGTGGVESLYFRTWLFYGVDCTLRLCMSQIAVNELRTTCIYLPGVWVW